MRYLLAITVVAALACSRTDGQDAEISGQEDAPGREEPDSADSSTEAGESIVADVLEVRVSRTSGAYTFAVTLRSPDTGCDQYADWWEVLKPEGELIYRRILQHSHVDEQPFTRSGGPVVTDDTTELIVRAHMSNAGYGGVAFAGSIASEFAADPSVPADLAPELADMPPQPSSCAF